MSYDISLLHPGRLNHPYCEPGCDDCHWCRIPVKVARHEEGGTYALGGIDRAELNVTYNYWPHFRFGRLDGRTAHNTIPMLAYAVRRLGTQRDQDYWAATPGNAGHAASILLGWARQHPDAVWRVT